MLVEVDLVMWIRMPVITMYFRSDGVSGVDCVAGMRIQHIGKLDVVERFDAVAWYEMDSMVVAGV